MSHLMRTIASELDKPASSQMMHNLIGYLEASIRATNVQAERKDVVDKLDIVLDHRAHKPGGCKHVPSVASACPSSWDPYRSCGSHTRRRRRRHHRHPLFPLQETLAGTFFP